MKKIVKTSLFFASYLLTLALGFGQIAAVGKSQVTSAIKKTEISQGDAKSGQKDIEQVVYKLRPMDLLKVEINDESEFPKEVRVGADGNVTLPHIHEVKVGDLTRAEAEKLIQKRYEEGYYVNPVVHVQIAEYSPQKVQVLGQVNKPGFVVIPAEGRLTLTHAVSGAEGLNLRADGHTIQVRRVNKNNKTEVIKVDFIAILKKPDLDDVYLQNGDIIFVPESIF